MIAGILGPCFIDMPYAITKKCSASAIEKREENVQHAIHLLDEAEEIIKSLQQNAKVTPTNSSNSDSHSSSSDEIQIALRVMYIKKEKDAHISCTLILSFSSPSFV